MRNFLRSIGPATLAAVAITAILPVALAAVPTRPNIAAQRAATGALDYAETTHLVFMREEEKLARDVYLTFAQWYPNETIFKNIAQSEQTHTDAMRDKLAQFGIPDPDPGTDNLPSSIGVFTGSQYGGYMTEKFKELTGRGSQAALAALQVGALIEELDMHDIAKCPTAIVESHQGMAEDSCGMNYTDEQALIKAYGSLLDGSKNHLRAFVSRIEAIIGAGNYRAQYLTQDEVNSILGR